MHRIFNQSSFVNTRTNWLTYCQPIRVDGPGGAAGPLFETSLNQADIRITKHEVID